MKYGYARVSTDDQTPALQLAALKKAGCKTIFKDDGLSGATTKRPALLRCLKKLESGDTLIVWKLDRLGRSLRDLIAILWQMIGILAELERSLISERTRAGVKDALRRGVKFGRKPKLTRQQIVHAQWLLDQGGRREDIARLLMVDRSTLYRALATEARDQPGTA